jgi:hypothetical protein
VSVSKLKKVRQYKQRPASGPLSMKRMLISSVLCSTFAVIASTEPRDVAVLRLALGGQLLVESTSGLVWE